MTLQAQTESGAIDLLVCDYLGGELRGYVRHDRRASRRRWPEPVAVCPVRQGLSGDHFRPADDRRAIPGHRPARGRQPGQAAQSYFAQSEQIPSLVRLAAEKRDGRWFAGGLLFQHLPEGEEGRDRIHTQLDHPDWPHVAVLAGSVKAEELADPALPLDDLIWRLFHEEDEVRILEPLRLTRGCRCDPDYVRSVIARFPEDERQAMVGARRPDPVDCAFCSLSFPIALDEVD